MLVFFIIIAPAARSGHSSLKGDFLYNREFHFLSYRKCSAADAHTFLCGGIPRSAYRRDVAKKIGVRHKKSQKIGTKMWIFKLRFLHFCDTIPGSGRRSLGGLTPTLEYVIRTKEKAI